MNKHNKPGSTNTSTRSLLRRDFLQHGLVGLAAVLARPVAGCSTENGSGGNNGAGGTGANNTPKLVSRIAEIGELAEQPDANGVRLPPGFTSRIVARTGEKPIETSDYTWHIMPDGGATFATEDGGWIYVSNSEWLSGGAGALRFNAKGDLVDAYPILEGSVINCAGGKMPWGTWLSCEEAGRGRVFECDPFGKVEAVELPALGIFKHEAAAYDPIHHHVFLSEDEGDGRFYRFVPAGKKANGWADLTAGELQVAELGADDKVTWHTLPDPQFTGVTATKDQVPQSTVFDGGEGLFYHDGVVYLSTKGDNRVWAYDVVSATMTVLYDRATSDNPLLKGVDNVTGSCCGDILVAEDGGDMQIIALLPNGTLKPLMQIPAHIDLSEVTGPAFDPSGTRLYFSSQRPPEGGTTYEITGPFHGSA